MDIQEHIQNIQLVQQNIENLHAQKQQFQLQQTEVETALSEISADKPCYKIVGTIMIKADFETLHKELEEKKQMLDVRISSVEKQESKLKQKFESLQQEVMTALETKQEKKDVNSNTRTN